MVINNQMDYDDKPVKLPSGELTVCYWKWTIYFVDFSIKNGDFPLLC
jgi:hypothetical protein